MSLWGEYKPFYVQFRDMGTVYGKGCGTQDTTKRSRYMKDAYELGKNIGG